MGIKNVVFLIIMFAFIMRSDVLLAQNNNTSNVHTVFADQAIYSKKKFVKFKDLNLAGHGVLLSKDTMSSSSGSIQFDLSGFPNGTYLFYSYATNKGGSVKEKESSFMTMQFGHERSTNRILYDGYAHSNQYIGRFDLNDNNRLLRFGFREVLRWDHYVLNLILLPKCRGH